MQLTPEQYAVVQHAHGHAKVLAVAGAGKTTTLAHFIAGKLAAGVEARRMLVLMYNKAAQLGFTATLQKVAGQGALPQVRTFHSLALRIYQRLISQGFLPAFQEKILSDSETEQQLFRMLQQLLGGDEQRELLDNRKKWLEPAMSFIEQVKAGLDPAQLVFERGHWPDKCQCFVALFEQFEEWRQANRRITFSDMLFDVAHFFSRRPDIAAQFAGHMDWILVDEYQDINPVQQFLLETLAGQRASVMVIGDADQTIYGFRGSEPAFILHKFDERFTAPTLYPLSTSFRYGHAVALAASALINHNLQRQKLIATAFKGNPNTSLTVQQHPHYAQAVVGIIQQQAEFYALEDIAVLNRVWAVSAPIELALLAANIPYQLDHHLSVLQRSELQPFRILFAMAAGLFHGQSVQQRYQQWLVLLTQPFPKVKRQLLDELAQKLALYEKPGVDFNVINKAGLNKWQFEKIDQRLKLAAMAFNRRISAAQLVHRYSLETEYLEGLKDNAVSGQQVDDAQATVRAFLQYVSQNPLPCEQMHEHLQQLQMRRDAQDGRHGVLLTSVHKAKGLEWPVVIIPGLSEQFFPYQSEGDFNAPPDIEAERRLLYVAMTRARQHLFMVVPKAQTGKNSSRADMPSRFMPQMQLAVARQFNQGVPALLNLPAGDNLLEGYLAAIEFSGQRQYQAAQVPVAEAPAGAVRIRHKTFGPGQILGSDGRFYQILFDDGKKRALDKTIADKLMEWL
ncbi:MAG: ATP-dependent helicase [Oceanospirillaceae bacterium]|nr:ATP-dependent helicase [Oceanospirillaceae bacterium]